MPSLATVVQFCIRRQQRHKPSCCRETVEKMGTVVPTRKPVDDNDDVTPGNRTRYDLHME